MILERIKEYIDFKGITVAAFERSVGMSNASFSKSLKNKGAIGTDKLENILSIYSDISPEWLLTGEGEMLKSKRTMGDNPTTVQPTSCNKDTQNNPDTQDLIRYLNNTIRQQAEEIGCLKERIRQMTIEKEKHVSDADTANIANAG